MGIMTHLTKIKACDPSKAHLGQLTPQEAWDKITSPSWVAVAVCRTSHNSNKVLWEVLVSLLREDVDKQCDRYRKFIHSVNNIIAHNNTEACLTRGLELVAQLNYKALRASGSRVDYREVLQQTVCKFKELTTLPYTEEH